MRTPFRTIESDPDELIPLARGAEMLGLDPSTIRKRKAGTENLTIVPQGKKFYLIRGEIIAHRKKLIDDARRRTDILRIVRRAE